MSGVVTLEAFYTNQSGSYSPYGTGTLVKRKHLKARTGRYKRLKNDKLKEEEEKQRTLNDESIPLKQCKECGDWFPAVPNFFIKNHGYLRTKCGKWGNNCDANSRAGGKGKLSSWEGRNGNLISSLKNKLTGAKTRAKDTGKEFKLTPEGMSPYYAEEKFSFQGKMISIYYKWIFDQYEKQDGKCPSGLDLWPGNDIYKSGNGNLGNISVDRIENPIDYLPDNCQLTTVGYNYMKNKGTEEEAQAFIIRILNERK